MTTIAIERYARARAELALAQEWVALVGRPGTRPDEIALNVTLAAPNAGARMPPRLRDAAGSIIKRDLDNILPAAIVKLEQELQGLAADAAAEYAALLAAAGL